MVFAVYEKLTAQSASTSEDLQAMAAMYQNLAKLLRDSGQLEEAEKAYEKGLTIREKLATDFPHEDRHVWDLAACYIDAGHLLQDNNRHNEAAKIYERARKFLEARQAQFPEQTEYRAELGRIHNHIGWLLASSGRLSEAEKAHRQALDLYEKLAQVRSKPELNRRHRQELAWTHEWLGHVQTNSNRPQEAEKAFRQVIALEEELNTEFPNQGHLGVIAGEYCNLARLFIRLSQWDKAAAEYAKAELYTRPLREDAFAYACLFLLRGDREGYNRFCQGMIQRAAQTEAPLEAFVLARSSAMERKSPVDPARIVQWANQVVASGDYAWYVHVLGLAQYRAGQFDQALQSLTRANVEYWPCRDLNWFGLALVHHRLGHPDEARRCLDRGIQWLDRQRPRSPEQPANIHPMDWLEAQVLRREALDETVVECRKAIERNPKDAKAHYNLGVVLHHQGESDQAVTECRKAVALDPKFASAHEKLGMVLRSQGKLEEAVAEFQEVHRLKPDYVQPLNDLAWSLATTAERKNRDGRQAVALARLAVKAAPADGNFWNTLGAAHCCAGNWKEAVATLEKSMELRKGGNSEDWFFLAMAQWQLGDKDKARKWFDQAAEWMDKNQPKNEELRRFRAEAAELMGIDGAKR